MHSSFIEEPFIISTRHGVMGVRRKNEGKFANSEVESICPRRMLRMQQFDIHRNEHLFTSFLGFASAFGETSGAIETKNVRALVIDEADAMPASQVICTFQVPRENFKGNFRESHESWKVPAGVASALAALRLVQRFVLY